MNEGLEPHKKARIASTLKESGIVMTEAPADEVLVIDDDESVLMNELSADGYTDANRHLVSRTIALKSPFLLI